MLTVGQILKKRRVERGLEIAYIARQTKIQTKFLEALERDAYQDLPSSITARGFIKLYGSVLGLPSSTLLALFRRDFMEDKSGQIIPRGVVKPLSETGFTWTPKHTIIVAVVMMITLLGAFLYREYLILVGPPKLTIDKPRQNAEVKGTNVDVIGETHPENKVFINNEEIEVDEKGMFSYVLTLPPGENTFTLHAKDSRGRTTDISRTIEIIP